MIPEIIPRQIQQVANSSHDIPMLSKGIRSKVSREMHESKLNFFTNIQLWTKSFGLCLC